MFAKRTLNLICGGPNAGKTTLTTQSIASHLNGTPPLIPELAFPPGRICYITTDRSEEVLQDLLRPLSINPSDLIIISLLTEYSALSNLGAKTLRAEVSRRIAGKGVGTIILDLYEDFQSENAASLKTRSRDGRDNTHWAMTENIALVGLTYPFKQRTSSRAVRIQDQISGSLGTQASAHHKIILMGPDDNDSITTNEPHWDLHIQPGPGGGPPSHYTLTRSSTTPFGFFERLTLSTSLKTKRDDFRAENELKCLRQLTPGQIVAITDLMALTSYSRATCYRRMDYWAETGLFAPDEHGKFRFNGIN
jgi:hypothetical protein